MSKKLLFLVFFSVAVTFSTAAQGGVGVGEITDPNYNLSFEYLVGFVKPICSVNDASLVMAWDSDVCDVNFLGWPDDNYALVEVELACDNPRCPAAGEEDPTCGCRDWDYIPDGEMWINIHQWSYAPPPPSTDINLWQTLDSTYDTNVLIQADYAYTVTYEAFEWEWLNNECNLTTTVFYGDNPDANVITKINPDLDSDFTGYSLVYTAGSGDPCLGQPLGIKFTQNGRGWAWVDDVQIKFAHIAYASEPKPSAGATVSPISLTLSWKPGQFAPDANKGHEVYFDSNYANVRDMNRSDSTGVYRGAFDSNSYPVPETLVLDTTYYWRIDEVNKAYVGPSPPPPPEGRWKGAIWSLKAADHLVVDDFDGYATKGNMTTVWTQTSNALIDLIDGGASPSFTHDGNSMEYYYDVTAQYSEIEADANLTDAGTDWTNGPVALALWFRGLPVNAGGNANRMYVGVEDGDGNVGVVPYDGDANDIKKETWQEWNIALSKFDACDVNLANVDKFYIGLGDRVAKPGGGGPGTVYFDDIELHLSRCVPSEIRDKGNFDNDCAIGYDDLSAIGADWLANEGAVSASAPSVAPIILYDFEDTFGDGYATNTGSYGGTHDADLAGMTDPCTAGKVGSGGLHFEVGDPCCAVIEAPLNLTTNAMTMTAWVKRNGSQKAYTGIMFTRDVCDVNVAGLNFGGAGPSSGKDNWWLIGNDELQYNFNNNEDAWGFHSWLEVPNNTWTFVAVVVNKGKATLYMSDGVGEMQSATNYLPHSSQTLSGVMRVGKDGVDPNRAFEGDMDEVRIYDYALSAAEVLSLAGGGTYTQELTTDIYDDNTINFKDYDILADNWLKEIFWP